MSKLDDLIKELCPDGVEYKTLGEVCRFQNGFSFKSPLFKSKGLPILRITNISNGEISDSDYVYFEKSEYKEDLSNYEIKKGDVVVAMSGATTGKIGYNYSDNVYYLNQRVGLFVPNEQFLLKRYLFHWLTGQSNNILHISSGSGAQPNLSSVKMMEFEIPVPPLPVQEEIVRILDKFTSLTAELTAELTARRKQYEYYRDSLLSPESISREFACKLGKIGNADRYLLLTRETKVEVKKLGDFATITRGGNFQKKDFVESGLPCIHYGQMYTHFGTWTDKTLTFVAKDVFYKSKQAQPNDIVMAVTSENVDDVCKCTAWVGKEPIAVSGHTAIIHHNQNAKYLSYYFQSSVFYKQKVKLAHGTKVIEVTPDKLNDITIPLPPLDVQQRIVNVLDNFDSICSDLKIGLPAEIEARKKQYEYYRDLLLTFASSGNTILSEQNRTEQNRTEQNR